MFPAPKSRVSTVRVLLLLWLGAVAPSCLASPVAAGPAPEPATAATDAVATRDEGLFIGETKVSGEGVDERRSAIGRALVQVLVRLTGDRRAPMAPVVRKAMLNAEALTRSVEYRDSGDAVPGTPYTQSLVVQFDPSAVEALIAATGLKWWPPERPRPLLWLAIDDGRGPRLVGAQQLNVVRPLAQRGLERGLRFGLPAGGAVEQAAVESLWALNAAAIAPLSGRYQTDAQLLGKLYRAGGGGWTAEWLLTQAGIELSRWSVTELDPQRAIADGADGAADALAKRDAVAIDVGEAGVHDITITGIGSAEDYTRLMAYLQTLAVVRGLQVVEATPASLRLRVDLAVGERGFVALVAGGATLSQRSAAGEPMSFQLQP